jgi:hypothetical protein
MVMNRSPLGDRYQGQARDLWRELGTNVNETIRQRFLVGMHTVPGSGIALALRIAQTA